MMYRLTNFLDAVDFNKKGNEWKIWPFHWYRAVKDINSCVLFQIRGLTSFIPVL